MHIVYLLIGLLIYISIASDIVKTTLSANGGGFITNAISRIVWNIFFVASGRKGRSRVLEYAGPSILIAVLLVWVLGLWLGFFLLLLADPDSILKSSDMTRASNLEKFYYAGFTLSTLGVGDYIASNNIWRVTTSVAAFSGLAFITASITYFVPVLSAVGLMSKLSLYINSMGKSPQEIITNSWNGENLSSFFDSTSDLCKMLMEHTMNHHAYPVIHYFHNSRLRLAITRSVVLLHETHKILSQAVDQKAGIDKLKLNMLQTALETYLEMVKENYIREVSPKGSAPVPDLSTLDKEGIPLQSNYHQSLQQHIGLDNKRELLTAVLEMNGWSWKDVYHPES